MEAGAGAGADAGTLSGCGPVGGLASDGTAAPSFSVLTALSSACFMFASTVVGVPRRTGGDSAQVLHGPGPEPSDPETRGFAGSMGTGLIRSCQGWPGLFGRGWSGSVGAGQYFSGLVKAYGILWGLTGSADLAGSGGFCGGCGSGGGLRVLPGPRILPGLRVLLSPVAS
ncbi:glycosyltransferase [Streptomyces sp. NBRC 110611]|nr:glycosyltransferase [Streptomyces sp. NBRC 110611]